MLWLTFANNPQLPSYRNKCRWAWSRWSGLWGCAALPAHGGSWAPWGHSRPPGCQGFAGRAGSWFWGPACAQDSEGGRIKRCAIKIVHILVVQHPRTRIFTDFSQLKKIINLIFFFTFAPFALYSVGEKKNILSLWGGNTRILIAANYRQIFAIHRPSHY